MDNEKEIIKDCLIFGLLISPFFYQLIKKYRKDKKYTTQILRMNSPSSILQSDELRIENPDYMNKQYKDIKIIQQKNPKDKEVQNSSDEIFLSEKFIDTLRKIKKTQQSISSVEREYLKTYIPLKGRLTSKQTVSSLDPSSKVPKDLINNKRIYIRK